MKANNPFMLRTLKSGFFFVLILLSALSGFAKAAQITVSTDRNPVSIDESFHIIFTADESPDEDPDFSPLEQDFEILGQSSSSNSSWINGKSSKTIQWTLTVMAKQVGSLIIPAIKFGSDMSQNSTIQVNKGDADKNVKTDDELFLDVEATPLNPYVQSQILYTLKLYTKIDIAQARLNEPELEDAVIEKLGEDSNYNTQVNGVSYTVTERKYAIFPQKSGRMAIKPLILTAEVLATNSPSFNGFFSPQITKTKRVQSKEIELDVKPVPAEFTGRHWLSAEELHLQQEWSGDINQMKVGEPLTRTLTLLAKGTTVGQLPELNTGKIDGRLKAYPDQPVLKEQKKPDGIIAFREEKIALIPSKSGNYILPAITVPWFNSKSRKMEIATIPETTISAATIAAAPSTPSAQSNKKEIPQKTGPVELSQPQQERNIWLWVSCVLAFGWLATVLYFLTKRPADEQIKKKHPADNEETDVQAIVDKLKQACNKNDAVAAKDSLIEWGRHKFDASNLGVIATCCDARLRDEIQELNRVLYGKEDAQWQGKKLFQAFTENKARAKIIRTNDSALEPLFRI